MMFFKTAIVSAAIIVGISALNLPKTRDSTFCDGNDCVKLPVRRILKFYKDLLLTKGEIQKKLELWAMKRKEKFGQGGAGPYFDFLCKNAFFQRQQFCKNWRNSNQDYDLCCPTQIHHMLNNTLVNTNGAARYLVKLINPDRQQFIPEATCLSSGACFAGIGTCRLDTISVWLLVFNVSLPLFCEFDEFEIPAYCSCKTN